MGTREVAYVFVPCLAHDSSQYQDKVGLDDVELIKKVVFKLLSCRAHISSFDNSIGLDKQNF